MLRFKSLAAQPGAFERAVAAARTAIQTIVKNNGIPASKDFEDLWGDFKADLLVVQRDKCGYCELFLSNQPGAVEHFSPKAGVQVLPDDREDWGKEGQGDYSVTGRRLRTVSRKGYWWRAYEWENYLAACERCNSGWKRNLFPVREVPRQPPEEGRVEVELLLNPFRGPDPADHLEYDKLGQVTAYNGSPYGAATIQTCGLDRDSLVRARNEKVTRAFELVEEYGRAANNDERTKVITSFIKMGRENYEFAGMVRAIFKQKLNLAWDDWEAIVPPDQGGP